MDPLLHAVPNKNFWKIFLLFTALLHTFFIFLQKAQFTVSGLHDIYEKNINIAKTDY